MGQYWIIVCMDTQQASGNLGKMGEILFSTTPDRLVDLLTTCNFPRLEPLPVKPTEIYTTKKLSSIEALPLVIQDKICSFLRSTDDMLCFALSCYRFIEIGRRNIIMHEKSRIAPWAGERIICIGDYADDCPEDFLTDEEINDIDNINLYEYCGNFEKPIVYKQLKPEYYTRAYRYISKSNLGINLLEKLLPINKPVYAEDSKSILVNLTTNEYVRASKIPRPTKFEFGHILLLQICWSSDPSMSIAYNYPPENEDKEIHRGPWAGHRFEITEIKNIDNTFKDVSDEVISKISEILENEEIG
ncbi:hypothetical protein COEREDRAFT_51894 [Coemansia reversa NRRL 1564]|uniref:F-box domain-containing protein n=1 Tax=Coemansia reversa (strain ATCC 12441 / NRRL 1564) TaxID=763665 RepID=A0A2G5B0L6_COERN|nr:hypothetical protein COEREDRAFT_51894 [Coemansia reversa NRRL 1564]|eukprot:PIA12568.1 hypothetical protein COEREDRAFT_51894 [Coemansia reversa NRRL 1564]